MPLALYSIPTSLSKTLVAQIDLLGYNDRKSCLFHSLDELKTSSYPGLSPDSYSSSLHCSRKQSQAVAMKIVSRAQKSSRDPFITAFQRSLCSSLSLFSAKGIVSNTWRHGEINKDLRIPPGLWSSDSEIYYSDPYPFFPLYHIVTSTIVLWTLLFHF